MRNPVSFEPGFFYYLSRWISFSCLAFMLNANEGQLSHLSHFEQVNPKIERREIIGLTREKSIG